MSGSPDKLNSFLLCRFAVHMLSFFVSLFLCSSLLCEGILQQHPLLCGSPFIVSVCDGPLSLFAVSCVVDTDPHPDPHGCAHHFDNLNPHLDPHLYQIKIRIRIRIHFKMISWIRNRIRIRIHLQMTSQNVRNMSLF